MLKRCPHQVIYLWRDTPDVPVQGPDTSTDHIDTKTRVIITTGQKGRETARAAQRATTRGAVILLGHKLNHPLRTKPTQMILGQTFLLGQTLSTPTAEGLSGKIYKIIDRDNYRIPGFITINWLFLYKNSINVRG